MKDAQFYMPTRIVFGEGKLQEIGKESKKLGNKALIVTGRAAMRRLGVLERVENMLSLAGLESVVYAEVEPNPSSETVERGADIARREHCDLVIGLGGGSPMDVAKGIAVLITFGGSLWDYIGSDKVPGPTTPVIAVPTTSGTGSETTPYSVFTQQSTRRKDAIASSNTFPRVALVDPTLTYSMSATLTADTGMDALTHAIEAYSSRKANLLSDALALRAIELVGDFLPKAVRDGNDKEARFNMALAGTIAGMAIAQAGVGAAHGFGMSIGGLLDTPHGRTVGILLPYVMEYNLKAIPDKFVDIALAISGTGKKESMPEADDAVKAVRTLMTMIDFPASLAAISVRKEDIPQIVEDAIGRPDMTDNPRQVTEEGAAKLLESVI